MEGKIQDVYIWRASEEAWLKVDLSAKNKEKCGSDDGCSVCWRAGHIEDLLDVRGYYSNLLKMEKTARCV